MSTRLLCVLCAAVIGAAVWAQPPGGAANYNALIGGSDIIVLGGVEKATIPAPPAGGGGGGGAPVTGEATITLKVTKVMAGKLDAGTVDLTIPLRYGRMGGGGGGGAAARAWMPDVSVGKQLIIGLVKTQAGLAVTPGMGNVLSAVAANANAPDPATAIADAIKAFTYSVSVATPKDPLTIGGTATFTVTVKNTGTTVLSLNGVAMSIIQEGAAVGSAVTFTAVSDDTKDAAGTARTVAAGASADIKVVVNVVGPADWQKLDAKAFPMAASIAAVVTVAPPRTTGGGPGGGGGRGFGLKTPWVAAKLAGPVAGA